MKTYDNPLISIIVPNYNHESFLPQRFETIYNQTYKNIEVIILDDCSTDNSKKIIENYRNNPFTSKIIYNINNSGSPFKQWYKGIHLAKGELIWIAESDDYCELNFLEEHLKAFQKSSDVVMSYSDLYVVNTNGIIQKKETKEHCHNKPSTTYIYEGRDFITERMLKFCSVCNASSVLFRRDIALKISAEYTNYKSAGDYLFWILISEKGKIVKIDKPLDYFRQHHTNVTPRSYTNGTTYIEDYNIHKFLWRHKYLKGKAGFKLYLEKLEFIMYKIEVNPNIRKKILRKWNKYYIFNKYTIALCWKIIKKLG